MWTTKRFNTPNALLRLLNPDTLPDRTPHYGKPSKASRVRVLVLLQAILNTSAMLIAEVKADPKRNFWTNAPADLRRSVRQIQTILNDYPMTPTVEIGSWDELHFGQAAGSWRPLGEQLAVWDITRLAQDKKLYRVRECRCGRWFFAKRNDQNACRAACRHRLYEQSEAFKTKRREYMRGYYALKNSGKVK